MSGFPRRYAVPTRNWVVGLALSVLAQSCAHPPTAATCVGGATRAPVKIWAERLRTTKSSEMAIRLVLQNSGDCDLLLLDSDHIYELWMQKKDQAPNRLWRLLDDPIPPPARNSEGCNTLSYILLRARRSAEFFLRVPVRHEPGDQYWISVTETFADVGCRPVETIELSRIYVQDAPAQ